MLLNEPFKTQAAELLYKPEVHLTTDAVKLVGSSPFQESVSILQVRSQSCFSFQPE